MGKMAAPQMDKILKGAKDFNSQYSEACSKSNAIFKKGMEDIMGTMVSLAKDSAEKQAAFVKDVMSIKTANEFTEMQNKMAKASFEDLVAGATKISEISAKLLTESIEPVNAQISKAVKNASKSMAA